MCEFLGSTNTLINAQTIGRLSTIEPEYQNNHLDIYESPEENHYYAITVDTARGIGGDYSAFIVVDITEMPYKVVAKYRDNNIAPMLFPDVIGKVARDYNDAFVLVEVNDIWTTGSRNTTSGTRIRKYFKYGNRKTKTIY